MKLRSTVGDRNMKACQQFFEVALTGFFFYAGDQDEPPHVHVERDACEAKVWLDPVRLARSHGFAASEISKIEKLILENQQDLLSSWDEFFNG